MQLATAVNELGANPSFPWVMGVVSALFFAFIAHRTERSRLIWAVSGGMVGLTLTAIAMGLGHATAVPYSQPELARNFTRAAVGSGAVLGLTGIILLLILRRNRGTARSPKPNL